MEDIVFPPLSFSITDQYGGEMVCEFDPGPFFKAFAQYYRNAPLPSETQIEDALNEAVEEFGATREQAEAVMPQEIIRLDNVVAHGLMHFLGEHLALSIQDALNTAETVITVMALDTVMVINRGTKASINDALDEQKKRAQSRLRSGPGGFSNPFRFWADLLQAMRCVDVGGKPITQEKVAEQLGCGARRLQKQLVSHRIEWKEALKLYQRLWTP